MVNRSKKLQVAQEKFDGNVTKRGSSALKLKEKEEGSNLGPWLIGLLVFLVVGSAVFQIIRTASTGASPL